MADINITVAGMTSAALKPVKPLVVEAVSPELTKVKIETIAKELVKPWQYGTALHRFAKRHDVPIDVIIRINEAVNTKVALLTPVEVIKEK